MICSFERQIFQNAFFLLRMAAAVKLLKAISHVGLMSNYAKNLISCKIHGLQKSGHGRGQEKFLDVDQQSVH